MGCLCEVAQQRDDVVKSSEDPDIDSIARRNEEGLITFEVEDTFTQFLRSLSTEELKEK